jgi:hypothetical protein
MKRNLIALAAVGLALGASSAFADNSWAFDDAYWKQGQSAQSAQSFESVQPTQPARTQGSYDFVNQYNY